MEKKPLQAKNVVSFGDGTRISRPKKETPAPVAKPVAEAVEASEPVVKKETKGFIKKEAAEVATENEVSEMAPPRKAPEPEGIETRPLNLRQSRYLDEEPQAPDWHFRPSPKCSSRSMTTPPVPSSARAWSS